VGDGLKLELIDDGTRISRQVIHNVSEKGFASMVLKAAPNYLIRCDNI
jgi:hypothetical protein